MKNRMVSVSVLLLSLAASAFAHHGFTSWFDMSKPITVKGTVTSLEWTNPHSYIHIDVKDDKGAVENWNAEMGSVPWLARAGWKRNTVKPGDEITLIGCRARDEKPSLLLFKAVLANGQELQSSNLPLPVEGLPSVKPF
jgi:hypothetical protein